MALKRCSFVTSAVQPSDYPTLTLPEVALAGRSNVGKSSLINALANRRTLAKTSKTPGRTRTINFYVCEDRFYLVDLPGYGYARVSQKARAAWGPMIEGYLTERAALRGVIVLIDARHGPTDDDLDFWEWLKGADLQRAAVATKWDKVKPSEKARRRSQIETALADTVALFSAQTGEGKDSVARLTRALAGGNQR